MCVVGKNYRLQSIQLSKIPLSPFGYGGQAAHRATCLNVLSLAAHVRAFALLRAAFAELARQPKPVAILRAKVGGEYRARTGDLLVANQALSQLS